MKGTLGERRNVFSRLSVLLRYCIAAPHTDRKSRHTSVSGNGSESLWTLCRELKLPVLGEDKITSTYALQAGLLVETGERRSAVTEGCASCVVPKKSFCVLLSI